MRERWIVANGVRLHALEAGPEAGPLVVLLHGFPEYSLAWRFQLAALAAAGYHVVAPDQRGYNLSDKPAGVAAYALDVLATDVLGLADALGAARFRLAGHDWGAAVAWWVALRAPARVERLAILNVPHPAAFERMLRTRPRQMLRSWYIAFFQLPRLPEWFCRRADMRGPARALVETSRPGTFSPDDLARYKEAWRQPGAWTGMINYYRAAGRRLSRLTGSPRVDVPTLILWGDQDHFIEREAAALSLALCAQGRLVRVPEATHWIHLEEPDLVSAEWIAFFR
jgi:pimeloyl-ACP methyl ester carboxylesterase